MKILKGLLIGAVALALIGYFGFGYMKSQTKKASPEMVNAFLVNGTDITVDYSRPSKKGRVIFGELVPYGRVWRTGANEATTIAFDSDIVFGGLPVQAGTYTLWTIPEADRWTVILNKNMYSWGVNYDGEAQRDPAADVAKVEVPVEQGEVVEQFTISIEREPGAALQLAWDDVRVKVPIENRAN